LDNLFLNYCLSDNDDDDDGGDDHDEEEEEEEEEGCTDIKLEN
jgi:hypothetical protein